MADSTQTKSPPGEHDNRPPRLSACINNYKVEPDRRAGSGNDTCSLVPGQSPDASMLLEIMETVCQALEDDTLWGGLSPEEGSIWAAPGGQHPEEDKLSDPTRADEEQWAKLIEELFLGSAYGGPDIAASFPKEAGIGSPIQYIFERFQPPAPPAQGKNAEPDPAFSIMVACQHLTTYGALSRGLRIPIDLYGGGIPASQAASTSPIFHEGAEGRWYTSQGMKIKLLNLELPFTALSASDAHNADKVAKLTEGYGPGTIYTYNPMKHQAYIVKDVPVTDLMWKNFAVQTDSDGLPLADPRKGMAYLIGADERARERNKASREGVDALNQGIAKVERATGATLPNLPYNKDIGPAEQIAEEAAENAWTSVLGGMGVLQTARIPVNAQLTGSHASMVLRTFHVGTKLAVQMLDANAHATPGTGTFQDGDYCMFNRILSFRSGHFAGEAFHDIPATTGNFVGLGTLPALRDWSTLRDWICLARPVGLARLVLANCTTTPGMDDILFISKMIQTWGYATQRQNFHIARLLWSLRNTPYYKSVQAYWVVYAPRGALAVVMWEPGARNYTLAANCADAITRENEWRRKRMGANAKDRERVKTGIDMLPMTILTHDEHGRAIQLWRNHAVKAGGEGNPPKVLKDLFISTLFPPLDMLTKKQKELQKAFEKEQGARAAEWQRKKSAISAAAKRNDAAAVERLRAEVKELQSRPFPELEAFQDFIEDPFTEEHTDERVLARDNPFREFVHPSIWGLTKDSLPELLQ